MKLNYFLKTGAYKSRNTAPLDLEECSASPVAWVLILGIFPNIVARYHPPPPSLTAHT